MTNYELGTLTIVDHEVEKLTDALGISDDRFDDLITLAKESWEHEDTVSESIEYIAKRATGSELVLTLVFFGRIWEDNTNDTEE